MELYEELEGELKERIGSKRRLEGALESDLDTLRQERGELVNALEAIQALRREHERFNDSASDILGGP